MRDFDKWIETFRDSIANYTYYVEFDKVFKNTSELRRELNLLNSLIGSTNIESEFKKIVSCEPSVLKCIPILIATRDTKITCTDDDGLYKYDFENINYSVDDYAVFMRKTGIFKLLEEGLVGNIYDYVIGVEAGLNSNARKNRTGKLMENLVEFYIKKAGYVKNVTYYKEMSVYDLEKISGLDLSRLSNNKSVNKVFDYVIISDKCVYACECNFYRKQGSKLNETARSYKMLALEAKNIEGFKFVWFTDGQGWISGAKNNLKETFETLEDIYSIKDLQEGILEKF
ncbi:type II restriction endonuclease [Metamycoplasma spumans]|uniref:type II restriction endonuclease n=1 Tax=Metamycoplasma spumans TaxID=92406 RepID=UPI0034DCF616